MNRNTRRTTTAALALSLALGAATLLGSCVAPPGPQPAASGAPSPAPSTDASTPRTGSGPTPSAATPSAGWLTFTTDDGLSFDFPDGWSVTDAAGEMPLSGVFVDVVNEAGKPMASLRTNLVTGAECVDRLPFEVYDSEPMQAFAEAGGGDGAGPRYVFESRGDDRSPEPTRTTIAAYGITLVPEEAGATACPMFHLFLWPPSGAFFGGTYNPEHNRTPGDASLPYLEKAKLYAGTPEYQDIRKMITSLRPAAPS